MNQHPSFFIIGAAKSGTTSLWMYLKQHPDIYMPPTLEAKEPSFFCDIYGYHDFNAYLQLFSSAKGKKAVGEASTPYLTSPESATWIRKVYPSAKIIIVLRNPVDRAYSLYNWMIREGYEWIGSLEKALIAEKHRLTDENFKYRNPQYYYNYLYFHSGCYADQVRRYLEIFPSEQIKIILFEELKIDPVSVTQNLYDFLDVEPNFIPNIKVYNKTQVPFSAPLQFFIKQKLPRYLKKLRVPRIGQIQKAMFNANLSLGRLSCKVPQTSLQRSLYQMYSNDIQETANLTGYDLSHWLKIP